MTERRAIESDLDPLLYPWEPAPTNGLLTPRGFRPFAWPPGRRLNRARVVLPDEDHPVPLGPLLTERSDAAADARFLVVAVGSNMSPEVMGNKFRRRGVGTSQVLPFVQARMHDTAIGFYADAAPRGYVAATPYASPGSVATVRVSWLDPLQMAALDSTEPGYACAAVSSRDHRLELVDDTGEVLEVPETYYVYEAVAGVIAPGGSPAPFGSQTDLYARLAALPGLEEAFGGSPQDASAWLREEESRATFRRVLTDSGSVVHRPLVASPEASVAERVTYGQTPSLLESGPGGLRVLATPPTVRRRGEHLVLAHPSDVGDLGPTVEVRARWAPDRPGVLARLEPDEAIEPGTLACDQMIRDALAVDLQERVDLRPALAPRSGLARWLARAQYLPLRVHTADHRNAEIDVALMDSLAMQLLGIRDGDFVVLEGSPDDDGRVPTVHVRAVAVTPDVIERRQRVGGGLTARYPTAEEALGVHPDVADVMLDQALRHRLNLGPHKLCAVRARASVRDQLLTELRELVLVLSVALLGVLTVIENRLVMVVGVATITLLAAWIGLWKVRSRVGTGRR